MKRDTRISIAKALGIIFVVVAHTEGCGRLGSFLFEFHMPLFFICAGYFFSLKYLSQEGRFVGRRLKGLYLPFVKWSVFFLVIHNLLFKIGILNEQYGNAAGGVTHPYTWHVAQQRLWNIFFSMSGYDEFLAGAFWFFRGLFVASILYLLFYKLGVILVGRISHRNLTAMEAHGRLLQRSRMAWMIGVAICVFTFVLCLWKCGSNLKITTIAQGGYRDLMGCFFFGVGFLLKPILNRMPRNIAIDVVLLAVVLAFTFWSPSSMSFNASMSDCLSLPVPALCGFLLTYDISCRFDKLSENNPIRRFLVYCGNNTLIVFVLHVSAFKIVSAIKIAYYGLPWAEMGCHMNIHEHTDDGFWMLYSIVGVAVPLLLQYLYDTAKARVRHQ